MNRKGNHKKTRPAGKGQQGTAKRNSKSQASKSSDGSVRLNKYIANSGICSRREADENISLGLVTVNGKVVTEMGYKVQLSDEVRFDGRRINPEPKTYVLLNKPKGFATTTSGDKGRTVMDLVANATSARIKPVGRLGRNSTGLILFTNDDEMSIPSINTLDALVTSVLLVVSPIGISVDSAESSSADLNNEVDPADDNPTTVALHPNVIL